MATLRGPLSPQQVAGIKKTRAALRAARDKRKEVASKTAIGGPKKEVSDALKNIRSGKKTPVDLKPGINTDTRFVDYSNGARPVRESKQETITRKGLMPISEVDPGTQPVP